MYTYKLLIFGHNIIDIVSGYNFIDNDIKDLISNYDLTFKKTYNDIIYHVNTEYHGSVDPISFGVTITDDSDDNFIKIIKEAKPEDYSDYNLFLDDYIAHLLDVKSCDMIDDEYAEYEEERKLIDKFINWLKTTPPDFYLLEVSS